MVSIRKTNLKIPEYRLKNLHNNRPLKLNKSYQFNTIFVNIHFNLLTEQNDCSIILLQTNVLERGNSCGNN